MSQLQRLIAEYLNLHSGKRSLITVTDVRLSQTGGRATAFISVLPESEAALALNFAKRQRTELKKFVTKNLIMRRVPFLDFALDKKKE